MLPASTDNITDSTTLKSRPFARRPAGASDYDSTGKARRAHSFDYQEKTSLRIGGTTSNLKLGRLLGDAVDVVEAMFLPRMLNAQYGPCDALKDVAIQAAAVAAERWTAYYEAQEVVDLAELDGQLDAVILLLAAADLAGIQAEAADAEAYNAQFDYMMCLIDQAVEAALLGGGGDNWHCYDTTDYIYDPTIDDYVYTDLWASPDFVDTGFRLQL